MSKTLQLIFHVPKLPLPLHIKIVSWSGIDWYQTNRHCKPRVIIISTLLSLVAIGDKVGTMATHGFQLFISPLQALQWRYSHECRGVSNHRQLDCVLNSWPHTCQGFPGYFREARWNSMGLPEIPRLTLHLCGQPLVDSQHKRVSNMTSAAKPRRLHETE